MTTEAASYGIGAIAALVLAIWTLVGWRGRVVGLLLVLATTLTVLWSGLLAVAGWQGAPPMLLDSMEVLRFGAWYAFLVAALAQGRMGAIDWRLVALAAGACTAELVLALLGGGLVRPSAPHAPSAYPQAGAVVLALIGLVLVERLYKSTHGSGRWSVKYLALGLGGIFVYDFFMYADALLVKTMDHELWAARGAVQALAMPLIAASAARNPDWSLDIYVSRRAALGTTSVALAGLYLLVMAVSGFYIRAYGGAWGGTVQTVFLAAALLVLMALLFSSQLRAKTSVFLSKHFFNYKYDYREEWLRFIRTLSGVSDDGPLGMRVIRALAQPLESQAGMLWRVHGDAYVPAATWNLSPPDLETATEPANSDLVRALREQEWIVERPEWEVEPNRYGIDRVHWLSSVGRAWLIVPLINETRLMGFVVLAESKAGTGFNWEDRDLLKTAARQAASFLAQEEAAADLTRAKQFEAFSKLSAFVAHDLKNVISQLSMVARNAERHKHNPVFVDDAMRTVDNAVARMNRLMAQLRRGGQSEPRETVDLVALLHRVAESRASKGPAPGVTSAVEAMPIRIEVDRLQTILEHLVDNAQEATPAGGTVELRLSLIQGSIRVEVADTGVGMTPDFVRDRLFKPFDTTKGSKGMGVGAYEARDFVQGLGGKLEVHSEPEAGTQIEIQIPHDRVRAPSQDTLKELVS